MMQMCNPNTGMDLDIVRVVLSFHVCTNVYPEFLPYSNVQHLGRLLESSSSSSSSRLTYVFRVYLEDGCCRVSMWFCNGAVLAGKGILSVGMSSSLEKLKVKHHCTCLRCDCLVPVLHGVTGYQSKEAFSTLETWCILGGSSEWSGCVEVFTTTFIAFIF